MSRALLGKLVRAALAVGALAFFAVFAIGYRDPNYQQLLDLTVNGIAIGGVYALAGLGLVLTYKATGIFNFAHGAIAMLVAFLLWQLVAGWGVPLAIAAPLALLVAGPLLGLLLETVVFRPLERRGASVAEELVATLGIFVLVVGVGLTVWGPERKEPVHLFSSRSLTWRLPFASGDRPLRVSIGVDQLAVLAIALVACLLLWFMFRALFLGTRMRAVVDRRELAELAGIDSNRVSAVAWGLGAGLAGLTGALLAPTTVGLVPDRLSIIVIETFAVAVIARLVSLPVAVGGGLFLGLATAYTDSFTFADPARLLGASRATAESLARALDTAMTSLSSFVLFGALLLNRGLDQVRDDSGGSLVARSTIGRARGGWSARIGIAATAAALLALPLALDFGTYRYAQTMVALAVVFLSIVAVTGFSGHITLAQAGFAGFGAFMMGRLHAGTVAGLGEVDVVPAMLLASLLCVPIGFIAGYPALKRRGLFLGLTTLAISLLLSKYVFENLYFNSPSLISVERPTLFGLDLTGDTAFYYFEVGVLALVVLLTNNLRSGRLGRALGAMRDSETAARSVGISLRRYKLFIFSTSAAMAGLGGCLLTQTEGAFSFESFFVFRSLIWFAVVVVAGVTSISGALIGAALFTLLDGLVQRPGVSTFVIGIAAILLGRLPGGLVGLVRRATTVTPVAQAPRDGGQHVPTAFARRVLADAEAQRAEAGA